MDLLFKQKYFISAGPEAILCIVLTLYGMNFSF